MAKVVQITCDVNRRDQLEVEVCNMIFKLKDNSLDTVAAVLANQIVDLKLENERLTQEVLDLNIAVRIYKKLDDSRRSSKRRK